MTEAPSSARFFLRGLVPATVDLPVISRVQPPPIRHGDAAAPRLMSRIGPAPRRSWPDTLAPLSPERGFSLGGAAPRVWVRFSAWGWREQVAANRFSRACGGRSLGFEKRLGLGAAIPDLHRRTRDRAIGAEHAAIAGLGFQSYATTPAVVEELAGVNGHRLDRAMPALRTGQGRYKLHEA